jgi:hypothetical protein
MITDRDIWGSALTLVKEHGEDAATYAAMMADKFGAANNTGAQRVWHRIMLAATWLQDRRGRDPFKVEH